MRCSFCATGKGGFARNLAPHEIADQAMTVQEAFGRRVSNVGAFSENQVLHPEHEIAGLALSGAD